MTLKNPSILEVALYFIPLTVMYYFNTAYVNLGYHLMIKGIMCMVVILLAFLRFLVYPNLLRMKKLSGVSAFLILPNLVIVFWSLFSWGVSFTSVSDITRGLSSQMYQILAVLAMAGVLYALGENGIWCNLAAMLSANLIIIGQVIRTSGFAAYFLELRDTVLSFAAQTGELMKGTEVHELTFAIGLYLLYYLLFPKLIKQHWLLAVLTLFCTLSGFKRIGIAALAVSVVLGWVLLTLQNKGKKVSRILTILGIALVALAFAYIVLIRQGLFTVLAEQMGVETMGRSDLYEAIRPYYSLSPFFMGQGAGFVSRLFSGSSSVYFATMGALHNDFLQIYVDIGFIGFCLWGLTMLPIKTAFLAKKNRGKILCFCFTLYCLVTYATDNTYYYPYVNAAAAILIMGNVMAEDEPSAEMAGRNYE